MSNFRTAPKLYHNGNKKCNWFYFLPQQHIDAVFNRLDGKSGNMIKLMIVLMGTKGDGKFGISEKWIRKRTGMSKQNYHRALHGLEKLGLVVLEDKKITVNLNMLSYEEENDDEPRRPHQVGNGNHDDAQTGAHDDDYNI